MPIYFSISCHELFPYLVSVSTPRTLYSTGCFHFFLGEVKNTYMYLSYTIIDSHVYFNVSKRLCLKQPLHLMLIECYEIKIKFHHTLIKELFPPILLSLYININNHTYFHVSQNSEISWRITSHRNISPWTYLSPGNIQCCHTKRTLHTIQVCCIWV